MGREQPNGNNRPRFTREWILLWAGVLLLAYLVISVVSFGKPFNLEYLLAALTMMGISITQWGDKNGR